MFNGLFNWFMPKNTITEIINPDKTKPCPYPLEHLASFVGQTIEVHYLNQGIPVVSKDKLKCLPNKDFFYLEFHIKIKDEQIGKEYSGYSQILWDRPDAKGREYAVLTIKDDLGNIIYQKNPKQLCK